MTIINIIQLDNFLLRYFITFLFFVSFVETSYADSPVKELSVVECIATALENNPSLDLYLHDIHTNDLITIQKNAYFDQSLSMTFSKNKERDSVYEKYYGSTFLNETNSLLNAFIGSPLKHGGSYQFGYETVLEESTVDLEKNFKGYFGIALVQPLLKNFGKKVNTTDISLSKIDKRITEELFRTQASLVLLDVLTAYWGLVQARQTLTVKESTLAQADSLLEYNRRGVADGVKTETDVLEVLSEQLLRQQDVVQQRSIVSYYEDQLRYLLNFDNEAAEPVMIIPTDIPRVSEKSITLDEALGKAMENRPECRIIQHTIERSEVELSFAGNQKLPSLDMSLNYQFKGSNTTYSKHLRDIGDGKEYGWMASFLLSYPIKNRYAGAEYQKKYIATQRARQELDSIRKRIIAELKDALRQIEVNRRMVELSEKNVAANQAKLEREQAKLENQLSTTYFVLQFQNDLADAKNMYNKVLADYALSVDNLRRITGEMVPLRQNVVKTP